MAAPSGSCAGPRTTGTGPPFHTAARVFGPRVVGVVLSGTLSCGARGLATIKTRGGVAVVQDPADALFAAMPRNALARVKADHVLPAEKVGPLLADLVNEPLRSEEIAAISERESGERKPYPAITCPECNGSMVESDDAGVLWFSCHVGHTFTLDGLIAEQAAALEAALWASVRALEESAEVARRIATGPDKQLARRFLEKSAALLQHAGVVKEFLLTGDLMTRDDASLVQRATLNSDED